MQVILHIGTDKTGSTSIQSTIFLNRDWLLAHSIYVPQIGLGENSGHATLLQSLYPEQLEKLGRELRLAKEEGYRKALLSWEGMGSSRFGKAKIARLLSALDDLPIHIIVYLRDQAEIIQSGHLQRLKQGHRFPVTIKSVESPATLVGRIRSFRYLRSRHINYYRLLRRWEKSSARTTFSVRIYSKSQLKEGDVVTDFIDELGLCRDGDFIPAQYTHNESIDVESALLIESFHEKPQPGADIMAFIDVAQSVISARGRCTKYFLEEKSVRTIRNHFKRSNLAVARRYLGIASDPFVFSDCWRTESLSAIEGRGLELLKEIERVSRIPTLTGVATGEHVDSMLELQEGWCAPGKRGVWSVGSESKIRFRVVRQRLMQEVGLLRLVIEGRYYGENTQTNVSINGIDFGARSLVHGQCRLVLPVDALLPNELVEITLRHQHPRRPSDFEGKRDNRTLAFLLKKVACIPVRNHEQAAMARGDRVSQPQSSLIR